MTEELTEKIARAIILACKGDPDLIVQLGTPNVYGTPNGDVFAVNPSAGLPMWRMYQGMAKTVYGIVKDVDAAEKINSIAAE